MEALDRAIARLAAGQHGVIALEQVVELGGDARMAGRRCAKGVWSAPTRGVYVIAGSPATFEQRVMVAVLAAGPRAVASHRTAARLWGVAGRMSVPIEITVPSGRRSCLSWAICHRSRDLDVAGTTTIDGIPVTGLPRTLLDVAAVQPSRARTVLWRSMRTHDLGWDAVLQVLIDHQRRGRPGLSVIRSLVAKHYLAVAGDSDTEDQAYEILVDSGRVPVPDRLVPVVCADGVPVTVDLGWPGYDAYLEIWGVDHFRNEQVMQTDIHRENQVRLAGHALLVYSGKMLERPDQFVRDVMAMLRSQGWDGVVTPTRARR